MARVVGSIGVQPDNIIQLDFSAVVAWWSDPAYWKERALADTVTRETEDTALTRVYKQVRAILRYGRFPVLTRDHERAMFWDCLYMRQSRGVKSEYVTKERIAWIAARSGLPAWMVEPLLCEAREIQEAREILGLRMDWEYQPTRFEMRVVKQVGKELRMLRELRAA